MCKNIWKKYEKPDGVLVIISRSILDNVKYTNIKIMQKSASYKEKHYVNPTFASEIKAVIGLLYLAGVFRSNR